MPLDEWTVTDARGTRLLRRRVADDAAPPRGAVVLVHGVQENSALHLPGARALAAAGLSVELVDLPGWGRSGGPRGDAADFDHYVEAVALALDDATTAAGGSQPAALLGHSLGAVAAALCAAARPRDVAALALVAMPYAASPALGARPVGPGLAAAVPRALARLAALRPFCARVPVLALHGEHDDVATTAEAGAFFAARGRPDALVETVPGAGHDLLREERVLSRLAGWIAGLVHRGGGDARLSS